jgi:hypothetical protein
LSHDAYRRAHDRLNSPPDEPVPHLAKGILPDLLLDQVSLVHVLHDPAALVDEPLLGPVEVGKNVPMGVVIGCCRSGRGRPATSKWPYESMSRVAGRVGRSTGAACGM